MKFINMTRRNIYNSLFGMLAPGHTSVESKASKPFADAMKRIVEACSGRVGIILNEEEVSLMGRIVDLDESGSNFDRKSIPQKILDDPTGEKRAMRGTVELHDKEIRGIKKVATAEREREKLINGEISGRRPAGIATMKGDEVTPDKLMSGFEKIMEENERIEKSAKSNKINAEEILDPIGKHLMGSAGDEHSVEAHDAEDATPGDASPLNTATQENDPTRSANAEVPDVDIAEKAGDMDMKAAEIAEQLSTIGPSTKRRRSKKA